MNIEKTGKKFEKCYEKYNVLVTLAPHEVTRDGETSIFDIVLKGGTRKKLFFDRTEDVCDRLGYALAHPFKEGSSIRLAVSRKPITEKSLRKMLVAPAFRRYKPWIPIPLGYDVRGAMRFTCLAKIIHALYGGATNSGKTVGLRNLVVGIISIQPIDKVNLVIIDTGAKGLDLFDGSPHLSYPIVKDEETAVKVMLALVEEMERRKGLSSEEVRQLPAIVCIVDEYISLVTNITNGKEELLKAISNLLRRGRHAKMHMVLATQESTKRDMLIGLNNIGARMAFTCSDFYSSRAILGKGGADKLRGDGAMLFKSTERPDPVYLQGAWMSTGEIEKLVAQVAAKPHDFSKKFVITEDALSQHHPAMGESLDIIPREADSRKELADIIFWLLPLEKVSALQIQGQFRIGNRAYGVMDELYEMKLVSEKSTKQPRLVLPASYEDLSKEVICLLTRNGYTEELVVKAFATKNAET